MVTRKGKKQMNNFLSLNYDNEENIIDSNDNFQIRCLTFILFFLLLLGPVFPGINAYLIYGTKAAAAKPNTKKGIVLSSHYPLM